MYDYLAKVILLGPSGAGKSVPSLLNHPLPSHHLPQAKDGYESSLPIHQTPGLTLSPPFPARPTDHASSTAS